MNLLAIGLATYIFKNHVASDIGIDQKFLSPENTQSELYESNLQMDRSNEDEVESRKIQNNDFQLHKKSSIHNQD